MALSGVFQEDLCAVELAVQDSVAKKRNSLIIQGTENISPVRGNQPTQRHTDTSVTDSVSHSSVVSADHDRTDIRSLPFVVRWTTVLFSSKTTKD